MPITPIIGMSKSRIKIFFLKGENYSKINLMFQYFSNFAKRKIPGHSWKNGAFGWRRLGL